jgi:hypothetical protein
LLSVLFCICTGSLAQTTNLKSPILDTNRIVKYKSYALNFKGYIGTALIYNLCGFAVEFQHKPKNNFHPDANLVWFANLNPLFVYEEGKYKDRILTFLTADPVLFIPLEMKTVLYLSAGAGVWTMFDVHSKPKGNLAGTCALGIEYGDDSYHFNLEGMVYLNNVKSGSEPSFIFLIDAGFGFKF